MQTEGAVYIYIYITDIWYRECTDIKSAYMLGTLK